MYYCGYVEYWVIKDFLAGNGDKIMYRLERSNNCKDAISITGEKQLEEELKKCYIYDKDDTNSKPIKRSYTDNEVKILVDKFAERKFNYLKEVFS